MHYTDGSQAPPWLFFFEVCMHHFREIDSLPITAVRLVFIWVVALRTSHQMEIEFKRNTLWVKGPLVGPQRASRTSGKPGYFHHDFFEWKGKRWGIRFQATAKDGPVRDTGTTHGILKSKFPSPLPQKPREVRSTGGLQLPQSFWEAAEKAREKWLAIQLRRTSEGVEGKFELDKCLGRMRSRKIGACANFTAEVDGQFYWGQFLLEERPEPGDKPVGWEPSQFPSAGLPSLGKRRP